MGHQRRCPGTLGKHSEDKRCWLEVEGKFSVESDAGGSGEWAAREPSEGRASEARHPSLALVEMKTPQPGIGGDEDIPVRPASGPRMVERNTVQVSPPGSPLQELPEKWSSIKKMAVTVRQQVAPLQANEVTLLRQRCSAFDVEQQQFWERFRREAPFR